MDYVVITPVKDEAKHFGQTLASMTAQTRKPLVWIIVDDGSEDGSLQMAFQYASKWDFIKPVSRGIRQPRRTGVAEIHAFNFGLEQIRSMSYDALVKLDADLAFEPDYFEALLGEFERDRGLGIASGVYYEKRNGEWIEVRLPAYHACGASKVIRRECFEDICGFVPERGWDTLDEIRAMACGWRTTHFRGLRLNHLKLEGSGMGRIHTFIMHGEIFYRTGGGLLFFVIKFFLRLHLRPPIIGSMAMLWGFACAALLRLPLLVTPEEGRIYRKCLRKRIGIPF